MLTTPASLHLGLSPPIDVHGTRGRPCSSPKACALLLNAGAREKLVVLVVGSGLNNMSPLVPSGKGHSFIFKSSNCLNDFDTAADSSCPMASGPGLLSTDRIKLAVRVLPDC